MYLIAPIGTFDHLLGKRVGRGYPEAPSYKPTHHLLKNAQSLPWAPIFLTLASEHDDLGFSLSFDENMKREVFGDSVPTQNG